MKNHFCCFFDQTPPFIGTFSTNFPISIVFVSDTPIFDVIRFFMTICDSPFCVFSFCFQIAVFYPVAHLLRCSSACICANIWFATNLSAHFNIFICPKSVGIFDTPCFIEKWLSVFSYSVLPMI